MEGIAIRFVHKEFAFRQNLGVREPAVLTLPLTGKLADKSQVMQRQFLSKDLLPLNWSSDSRPIYFPNRPVHQPPGHCIWRRRLSRQPEGRFLRQMAASGG